MLLNKPKSYSASCLETIGSCNPEDMKIYFLVRSGNVCGTSDLQLPMKIQMKN
jgi:hypothetical protein